MYNIFQIVFVLLFYNACSQTNEKNTKMNFNKLSPEEERILIYKGTERPFTGQFYNTFEQGVYVCKQCNSPLYRSSDKFESHCGWPSFDDEISGAVKRIPDADGMRIEIICSNCNGHLGHVFAGEGFTEKNIRHCVNSISLNFIPDEKVYIQKTEIAIFAGGCFWGVEYYFQNFEGVISTEVGYIGGTVKNPAYREVCNQTTGHAEAIKIVFDPDKTNFEKLARLFFEIHDPTQINRQGPDIGDQYRSEIFFTNEKQKGIALSLMDQLIKNGTNIVTELTQAGEFYTAEEYYQKYYQKNNKTPYCHKYVKRF